MRTFRLLLLALFFMLGSTASAMASVHRCCPDAACDIAQCVAMGCAPAPLPAAFNTPAAMLAIQPGVAHAAVPAPDLPRPDEEVWKPPN